MGQTTNKEMVSAGYHTLSTSAKHKRLTSIQQKQRSGVKRQ